MKTLFICDTPYQLFNTLNIVYNKRLEGKYSPEDIVDLYIIDQFQTAQFLKNNVEKTELFSNVYLLTRDETKFLPVGMKRNILMSLDFLNPKKFLKKRFSNYGNMYTFNYKYDCVYASGAFSTVAAIMKLNPKATFILYEDGIGSYNDDFIVRSSGGKLNRIFCRLFNVGSAVCIPSCLLVNNVKICHCTSVNKSKIFPLPKFSDGFITLCEGVFGCNQTQNELYIWLTQPADGNDSIQLLQDKVKTVLSKYSDQIIVRMHPREQDNRYYDGFKIMNNNDLWELSILKKPADELVLISNYSSAQITPKILFDLEPKLVFLFKLNEGLSKEAIESLEQKTTEIAELYRSPDRIYIPDTYDDLESVLNSLI